jgi:hypothetical protein
MITQRENNVIAFGAGNPARSIPAISSRIEKAEGSPIWQ